MGHYLESASPCGKGALRFTRRGLAQAASDDGLEKAALPIRV